MRRVWRGAALAALTLLTIAAFLAACVAVFLFAFWVTGAAPG
jgi:hypothetical protein